MNAIPYRKKSDIKRLRPNANPFTEAEELKLELTGEIVITDDYTIVSEAVLPYFTLYENEISVFVSPGDLINCEIYRTATRVYLLRTWAPRAHVFASIENC